MNVLKVEVRDFGRMNQLGVFEFVEAGPEVIAIEHGLHVGVGGFTG
jgi:hypothetical protein